MTKIIVLAGKKQSGKSSAANFIVGTQLVANKIIREFDIDDKGNLIVNAEFNGEDGEGILDLRRKDIDFVNYANECIWPYAKIYSLADNLKLALINIFGIDADLVFGDNKAKDTETHIKWKDFSKFLAPRFVKTLKDDKLYNSKMTVRDLLQRFGTEVCRKLDPNCWARQCSSKIEQEKPAVAIIDDCRFGNEFTHFKSKATTIKLTRDQFEDTHASEAELDKISESHFDFVIQNDRISIAEKNQTLLQILNKIGLLNAELLYPSN